MKKFISILICIILTLSLTMNVFAADFNKHGSGIEYKLSDNWNLVSEDGNDFVYEYYNNNFEMIEISCIDTELGYSLELFDQNKLLDIIKSTYSNQLLGEMLAEANNISYVTVKTDSEITKYETYNSVKYLRYEKAYTASAVGYYNKPLYLTVYVTAKNGKLYMYTYHRDMTSNHFKDFVGMLNSISYKSGEIKIKINNEYIHPDSDPMMINDRTLVPIRAVAEKMNYIVDWYEEQGLVKLTSKDGNDVLYFGIGQYEGIKNSEIFEMDVPPVIIGSRTYLPLRAVAEAMDAKVDWEDATKTVIINY